MTQSTQKESVAITGRVESAINFLSTKDLREFYLTNGYVSVKNLIPNELLEDIQNDLNKCFEEFSTGGPTNYDSGVIYLNENDKSKLHELHIVTSKITSITALTKIFSETCKILGKSKSPVLEIASCYLISIPKDKRLIYDFHQESNYMKGFGDIFNFHYPIFRKSTTFNGTMSILPKTHTLGTLDYRKTRLANNSYTSLIPTNINEIKNNYEEVHCELELGDCVIFHKDLMHKSNFNHSDLCRPAGFSRLTQSLNGDWIQRPPEEL